MEREQRGLTVAVPTGVGAIVLLVSGSGLIAVLLGAVSLSGCLWGFWPRIHRWVLRKSGLGYRQAARLAEAMGAAKREVRRNTEPQGADVELVEDGSTWLLAVTGRDEVRRYRAKVEVLDSNMPLTGASVGQIYTPVWQSNGEIDSELFPAHTDQIPLVRENRDLTPGMPSSRYEFLFANPEHHNPFSHTKSWVYGDDTITRPVVVLSVLLNAAPALPEPIEITLRVDDHGVQRVE